MTDEERREIEAGLKVLVQGMVEMRKALPGLSLTQAEILKALEALTALMTNRQGGEEGGDR